MTAKSKQTAHYLKTIEQPQRDEQMALFENR